MDATTFTIQAELTCTIRLLGPGDMESLVAVKADTSLHENRLRLQWSEASLGLIASSCAISLTIHPYRKGRE